MNIPPIPLSAINNFVQNNLVNRITSKSTIEKACGIVTYEIDDKHIHHWKNKWFVFIGCETDPDFPGEDKSSINEYLKENGNKGSNTLDFEEHSMIIDGSISDGNNAQLNICIRSRGFFFSYFEMIIQNLDNI
ncbi:hypothetical protein RhiirB3_392187 [Rhizophagus irregularis]|nr:hypothetical protein RhiirB3_392187 [Rhizophagus irregularis]